jgi:hypothetical protein
MFECYTIEAELYLSNSDLTYSSNNNREYLQNHNGICGVGGADSGGTKFYVQNDNFANPRLILANTYDATKLVSDVEFPLNQWVSVKLELTNSCINITKMYINGNIVAQSSTYQYLDIDGSPRFNVGRYDDNPINRYYNAAWRGSIRNFKFYGPQIT